MFSCREVVFLRPTSWVAVVVVVVVWFLSASWEAKGPQPRPPRRACFGYISSAEGI